MTTFWPSTHPSSRSPCRNASSRGGLSEEDVKLRKPIRGTFPVCCCARTPTGHAIAPPTSAMNSRRLMSTSLPRSRSYAGHRLRVTRAAVPRTPPAELVVETRLALTRPVSDGGGGPRKPSVWNALVSQQSERGDSFKTDVPAMGAHPISTAPANGTPTSQTHGSWSLDEPTKRARLAPGPELRSANRLSSC